jgi:hypothetical protein
MPKGSELTYTDFNGKYVTSYYNIVVIWGPFNTANIYLTDSLNKKYISNPDNKNYDLLESKPSFENFKAYQYEGYNMAYRHSLRKKHIEINVFTPLDHVTGLRNRKKARNYSAGMVLK